jgi:hypothetical protein
MINVLNFILLRKGMMTRLNIGRKTSRDEMDLMIMDSMGRGKLLRGGKNNLVVGEDRLEVWMHIRCLKNMNGVSWAIIHE